MLYDDVECLSRLRSPLYWRLAWAQRREALVASTDDRRSFTDSLPVQRPKACQGIGCIALVGAMSVCMTAELPANLPSINTIRLGQPAFDLCRDSPGRTLQVVGMFETDSSPLDGQPVVET